MKRRRPWTHEELQVLCKNHRVKTVTELQKLLPGRSAAAIYTKGYKLGLSMRADSSCRTYTAEELDYLREHYKDSSVQAIASKMPGRTFVGVRSKLHTMGLTSGKRQRWTEDEDAILLRNLDKDWTEIQRLLGWTRSITSIKNREYYLRTRQAMAKQVQFWSE